MSRTGMIIRGIEVDVVFHDCGGMPEWEIEGDDGQLAELTESEIEQIEERLLKIVSDPRYPGEFD